MIFKSKYLNKRFFNRNNRDFFDMGIEFGKKYIRNKLNTAKQCIDFKGITCDNSDCKNTICPLNKDYKAVLNEEIK